MQCSIVNNKGQVTIPMDIRNALGIHQKDKMQFEVDGKVIKLFPAQVKKAEKLPSKLLKKTTIEDLCGILPKPARAFTVEEMNRSVRGDL